MVPPPATLEPAWSVPLRKGATLRAFGKNYLSQALSPALQLLAIPDGCEVHLYTYSADQATTHTRCVLRSEVSRDNALHACWGPSSVTPHLLAVAWPESLGLWQVSGSPGGSFTVNKVVELPLDRKPTGLTWHPTASPPLVTVHDITNILFLQLTKSSGASSSHAPPPTHPPQAKEGDNHRHHHPRPSSPPPKQPQAEPAAAAAPRAYVAKLFSPSLPGALEGVSWSQWGRHLAVCMEGVFRVYDWPAYVSLSSVDPSMLPFSDTSLKKRVRAVSCAGNSSFAATTDTDLGLYSEGSSSGSKTERYRSPARASTATSPGAALHMIKIHEPRAATPATRLVDVDTARLAQMAMPDLLSVRTLGSEAAVCLAAVGSHTSDSITVFRLACAPYASAAVDRLYTLRLPAGTRPKGVSFVGSRLLVLTAAREGPIPPLHSCSFGEYSLDLHLYNLPSSAYTTTTTSLLTTSATHYDHSAPPSPTHSLSSPHHHHHHHGSSRFHYAAAPPPSSPFGYDDDDSISLRSAPPVYHASPACIKPASSSHPLTGSGGAAYRSPLRQPALDRSHASSPCCQPPSSHRLSDPLSPPRPMVGFHARPHRGPGGGSGRFRADRLSRGFRHISPPSPARPSTSPPRPAHYHHQPQPQRRPHSPPPPRAPLPWSSAPAPTTSSHHHHHQGPPARAHSPPPEGPTGGSLALRSQAMATSTTLAHRPRPPSCSSSISSTTTAPLSSKPALGPAAPTAAAGPTPAPSEFERLLSAVDGLATKFDGRMTRIEHLIESNSTRLQSLEQAVFHRHTPQPPPPSQHLPPPPPPPPHQGALV